MSVLAEFRVPFDEFFLDATLNAVPEVAVEIERVAADDEDVAPYFWASGADLDRFEELLGDDPSIGDAARLESHATKRFYRATWRRGADADGLLQALSDAEASILTASGSADSWRVEILVADGDALSTFHDACAAYDLSFDLRRLRESRHPEARGKFGVTDKQREALVAAHTAGYFEIPRQVTLEELSDRLDISPNALSNRLRRGHANLVANSLLHASPDLEESIPSGVDH